MIWLIVRYSLVLIREWYPGYCCVLRAHFSVSMLGCLCPGCGLCGFPWVGPLVGLLPVPWLWACLFWYSWLLLPGLWAGLWFVCPMPEVWAWFLFGRFACWHVFGVRVWFVSPCPGCELACIWLVCLLASGCVCSGLMLIRTPSTCEETRDRIRSEEPL